MSIVDTYGCPWLVYAILPSLVDRQFQSEIILSDNFISCDCGKASQLNQTKTYEKSNHNGLASIQPSNYPVNGTVINITSCPNTGGR